MTLDGTGTIATSQWQSLTDGGLDITGGDYSPASGGSGGPFASLDAINGSMLIVSGGGSLTLPKVTSYQPLVDDYLFDQYGNVFLATGTGSTLDLPALASISESGTTYDYTPLQIEASGGGTVELRGARVDQYLHLRRSGQHRGGGREQPGQRVRFDHLRLG